MIACGLCGETTPAVRREELPDGYPHELASALDFIPNARFFSMGESRLLHHVCTSPRMDADWWDYGVSWWACEDVSRDLDDETHFDLFCEDCAARWAGAPQRLQHDLRTHAIKRKAARESSFEQAD